MNGQINTASSRKRSRSLRLRESAGWLARMWFLFVRAGPESRRTLRRASEPSLRQRKDGSLAPDGWRRLARMSIDRASLEQVKLFEGLDAAALDAILGAAISRRVPASAILFNQGDEPRWLSLITDGRVKVGHI